LGSFSLHWREFDRSVQLLSFFAQLPPLFYCLVSVSARLPTPITPGAAHASYILVTCHLHLGTSSFSNRRSVRPVMRNSEGSFPSGKTHRRAASGLFSLHWREFCRSVYLLFPLIPVSSVLPSLHIGLTACSTSPPMHRRHQERTPLPHLILFADTRGFASMGPLDVLS
jgi:hypothetical protein